MSYGNDFLLNGPRARYAVEVMRATGATMNQALERLDLEVGTSLVGWQTDARDAYQREQTNWNNQAQVTSELINKASTALDSIIMVTDNQNRRSLDRFGF